MRRARHKRAAAFALTPIALSVALAYANPTGPTIVNGNVSMSTQGSTLTIKNTPNAIINWQSFSINAGEVTRFIQQSASSQVLNRVVGVNPSVILGALQSNGRVFLINPNGIVFGQGSQVNVSGLVASTLNLSNENFIAGRLKFDGVPNAGKITNAGSIKTSSGGQVILLAPQIENSGIIHAPDGDILLAAGRSANLVDLKNPDISVEIKAPADKVLNVGQLIAKNITVYGALIENSGVINATTAVIGEGGRISLRAKQNVTTTPTSRITAEGPTAGTVSIQAETGTAQLAGTISVESSAGVGGSIEAIAQQIRIGDGARLIASGVAGGGTISIGETLRRLVDTASATLALRMTQTIDVARTAVIAANAKTTGKGGSVVIRAQNETQVHGVVEAKSERQSGGPFGEGITPALLTRRPSEDSGKSDGGSVRIQSDSGLLVVDGTIDASALAGLGGTIQLSADVLKQLGMVQAVGADGGLVTMEARRIEVAGAIDASGVVGKGGTILVGGDFQGKNPDIRNATRTIVAPEATLRADAGNAGDGGKVIIWSDDLTAYYGSISARGGSVSGNGGFAEVSGKNNLIFAGAVDLRAPHGDSGTLLLDPLNIIVANSGVAPYANVSAFNAQGNTNQTVAPSTLDAVGGNVVLQAKNDIDFVGSSRVDLQACKLEYSIVSPK